MDDFEDPAVRRLRGVPAPDMGELLAPGQFWRTAMLQAYEQTPATLGRFLTRLVADAKTLEHPSTAALFAVGLRATLSALAVTCPEDVTLVDESRALAILMTELWLGWPVPRSL